RYLLHLRLQPVRRQLVLSGRLPAAVRHHEAGDAQRPGEAEAPHEHFVGGLSVLAHVLEHRSAALLRPGRPGRPADRGVAADRQACARVSSAETNTRESHAADRQEPGLDRERHRISQRFNTNMHHYY
uniref:Uncharacterized protein n=1 Tax=Salarias fasciatus TaxID=181472 RepID=A0A672FB69_SALFA